MSNKVECPACHSYTSGVFMAAINDEPCPYCGANLVTGELAAVNDEPGLTEGMRLAVVTDGERRIFTIDHVEKTRTGYSLSVTLDEVQR